MADLTALPVNPDAGFPQAFLFAFGSATYGFTWYVDIAESQLPAAGVADPTVLIDLSGQGWSDTGGKDRGTDASPHAILVMAVDRHDPAAVTPLLRRRVIPGLSYTAGQLLIRLDTAAVALGNLNATGSFGSVLDVEVGAA